MAGDNLLVKISPSLLEAMSIPGEAGSVDYFQLFGVDAENLAPSQIDTALVGRSKALRPWQNSPQHGEEAVALLPMLHRIGSILKDPVRRKAYLDELDRFRRGEQADPLLEFRDMVRAALADGAIDQASKAELLRFAQQRNIPMAEAGRVVNEIAAASRQAVAAPAPEEDYEFRLAGGGPEAFRANASAMIRDGAMTSDAAQQLIAEASKFSISRDEATRVLNQLRGDQFRTLIKFVAQTGVINNNQARLLMPKAANLGLSQDEAYKILSEFTFTGASQEDLSTLHLTTGGFEDTEIQSLLAKQEMVHYRAKRNILGAIFQSTAGRVALAVIILAALAPFAMDFISTFQMSSGGSSSPTPVQSTPSSTPRAAAPSPGQPQTPMPTSTQAAAPEPGAPTATETPVEIQAPADPPGGVLAIAPESPGDPPAFQIKIHEVTCSEYKEFLLANLYPTIPTGWGIDFTFPTGSDEKPVTGIRWQDAVAYCQWFAKLRSLPETAVQLPTAAQYARLARLPVYGSRSLSDPDFWNRAGYRQPGVRRAKATRNDVLLIGQAWLYDLIGNAAEWGMDEQGGQRAVLGGDYAAGGSGFDPRATRFADPNQPQPTIGFRYVILNP